MVDRTSSFAPLVLLGLILLPGGLAQPVDVELTLNPLRQDLLLASGEVRTIHILVLAKAECTDPRGPGLVELRVESDSPALTVLTDRITLGWGYDNEAEAMTIDTSVRVVLQAAVVEAREQPVLSFHASGVGAGRCYADGYWLQAPSQSLPVVIEPSERETKPAASPFDGAGGNVLSFIGGLIAGVSGMLVMGRLGGRR